MDAGVATIALAGAAVGISCFFLFKKPLFTFFHRFRPSPDRSRFIYPLWSRIQNLIPNRRKGRRFSNNSLPDRQRGQAGINNRRTLRSEADSD